MILSLFSRIAALGIFLLSSGVLHAASRDFSLTDQEKPSRLTSHSSELPDPNVLDIQSRRSLVGNAGRIVMDMETLLGKGQNEDVERRLAEHAQEMTDLMALFNASRKPKTTSVPCAPMIPVAGGDEHIYKRFLGGKLIYTDPSSKTKKELPIRALANPLEGTFDLSGCGDTGQYLSISTGYRKAQKPENHSKTEIWIAPRFVVERDITTTANHFQPIMDKWDAAAAPVGLFWTFSTWGIDHYDYLVRNSMEVLGSGDLLENYEKASTAIAWSNHQTPLYGTDISNFAFKF